MDFDYWFANYFFTGGYPIQIINSVLRSKPYDVIINVSDEYYYKAAEKILKDGIIYYYFPMGQSSVDMGLVSVFGAIQVLFECANSNKRVLVHCRKGHNRSQVIKCALYYMIKGQHINIDTNRLLHNCRKGHLPPIDVVEKWLLRCNTAFSNKKLFKGNMLDWCFSLPGLINS